MVATERPPHGHRRETGEALAAALLVLLLVAIALSLVAAALELRLRTTRREILTVHATALTDAAVAEALAHLSRDPAFHGLPRHPFGGGTLTSRVRATGYATRTVEARGTYGTESRTVRVRVTITPGGLVVSGWRRLTASP